MTERSLTEDYKAQIKDGFARVRSQIEGAGGRGVTLLAATKTLSAEVINYAIDELGLNCIGENRVQELLAKYDDLHKDGVGIHFIGRLQKNKVKYIVDKVDMIESVDSAELAEVINKKCADAGRIMDVLIEINIGGEQSKGGADKAQAKELVRQVEKMSALRVRGLMVIPPAGSEDDYIKYFSETAAIFDDVFGEEIRNGGNYVLSMGMSDSYVPAVKCGATEVRVGSALFGKRV